MGNTIRQHYVPRTYLKRFTFDGKRLHTFFIKENMPTIITEVNRKNFIKEVSLKDVCVSSNYYTIDESNSSNNRGLSAMSLEKDFFQNFAEPKLSSSIKTINEIAKQFIHDKQIILPLKYTYKHYYDLALCAFIQYHRSPRLRRPIEAIDSIITQILNKKSEGKIMTNKGLDIAFTHAEKTFLNLHLWNMFFQKISSYCMLIRYSENSNFFTSDNPVVIHKLGAKGKDIFNVNFYKDVLFVTFFLTIE